MDSRLPQILACIRGDLLQTLNNVRGVTTVALPARELGKHPGDLAILDPEAFENHAEFLRAYRTFDGIALIVARTASDEAGCMEWLKPDDDLCRVDSIASQLEQRLKRLYDKASTTGTRFDALTRLLNRHAFSQHVEHAANTQPGEFRIIMIDLDHFKSINDTHGHVAGDAVLVEIADLLRSGFNSAKAISRVGGDEFGILAAGSIAEIQEYAESIRKAIEARTRDSGNRLTASLGISGAIDPGSIERALNDADRCVYAAKAQGRNRSISSEARMQQAGDNNSELDLLEFEDLLRVVTDRVTNLIQSRGRRMFQKYQNQAEHDALTSLYNRGYLDRRLEREFQNSLKNNSALSIALIDLDHFGEVNRAYGYPTGDSVLRTVTAILQEGIRSVDWIARYGGEEFCLVMPGTRLAEAVEVAERLCRSVAMQAIQTFDHRLLTITASIGVVERMQGDATTTDLLQRASDKVRQAKTGGRNRVCG